MFSKTEKRFVTFSIFIIPFLVGLGVDLYAPSLPRIASDFGIPFGYVQMTVSLYVLGYGLGQVILGILSDSCGRKTIMLFSSAMFTAISLICLWSPHIFILQAGRFLQGIGVAGMAAVARAIMVDVYTGKELTTASNYFTLSWSLGPILAPFIGSGLDHFFGWRSNFVLFSLYGGVVLAIAFIKLPETNLKLKPFRLDGLYGDLKTILTAPAFMLITAISALGYASIVLFNVLGPFFVQVVMGYSVIGYGRTALVLGFAYFGGALANRACLRFASNAALLRFGLAGTLGTSILMIAVSSAFAMSLVSLILPVFVLFFLIGFIVPNALALTMEMFADRAGTASAVFGTLTGIFASVVTAFGGLLKTGSSMSLAFAYFTVSASSCLLYYAVPNGKRKTKKALRRERPVKRMP